MPARFGSWPAAFIAGTLMLCGLVIFAVAAPVFGNPNHQDYVNGLTANGLPVGVGNSRYILGTDTLGRSMLPRLAYGTRTSLTVAFIANATSLGVSAVVALVAGFYRRWTEAVLMRLTDSFLAMPSIPTSLFLAAFLPGGITRVVVIATIFFWAYPARVFYGEVLRLRRRGFVESSEAAGAQGSTIMFRHILPHLFPLVLTYAPLNAASAVLFESALSFIGAGITPPTASLGRMIQENQNALSYSPHLLVEPTVLILLVTMAFLLVGDGLKARNPDLARVSWLTH